MHVFHAINSQREAVLRDADLPEHIIWEIRMMEAAGMNAHMRRKVARLGLDSAPMGFALAYGPAVRSTLRHAQQLGADLIVAGKQGGSTVGGSLLGSVSGRVVSGSDCDMLIVPKPRDEAPPRAPEVPQRMPGLDLTDLQPQKCYQLAWFTYGWIEREHVLNMEACANWWIQAFVPASGQLLSPATASGMPPAELEPIVTTAMRALPSEEVFQCLRMAGHGRHQRTGS